MMTIALSIRVKYHTFLFLYNKITSHQITKSLCPSGWILRDIFFNCSAQTRTVVRDFTASYSGNIGTVVYRKISNQDSNENSDENTFLLY